MRLVTRAPDLNPRDLTSANRERMTTSVLDSQFPRNATPHMTMTSIPACSPRNRMSSLVLGCAYHEGLFFVEQDLHR